MATRVLPYFIVERQDVSLRGRTRLVLRIVIDDRGRAGEKERERTLRRAAGAARMGRLKRTKPDTVIVFGYRLGDDVHQAATLGTYTLNEWSV